MDGTMQETTVLIPQIASAMLALAFSGVMLVAGQSFIEQKNMM